MVTFGVVGPGMLQAAKTTTTTAMLEGLRDPGNETVWRDFDERYRPVLIGFAQRLGLTAADAEDAAQETLLAFMKD